MSDTVFPVVEGITPQRAHRWLLPSEKKAVGSDSGSSGRKRSSISTRYILHQFEKFIPSEERLSESEKWEHSCKRAEGALKRLVLAAQPLTTWHALKNLMGARPSPVQHDALLQDWETAVEFYAPPRSQVPVYITDFCDHRSTHTKTTIGKIEDYLDEKPPEVRFRWIHIPIGRGLLQSTIEELFTHTGSATMGKPFRNTGTGGWPYPAMVLLSFWSQKFLKARTAAHKTLRELSSHRGPHFRADWKTGFSRRQRNDLVWRAELFGKDEPDHWELLEADFPSVLDQPFLGQHTPLDPRTTMATRDEEQALNMHKDFKGAILMTNDLRAFHRNDGFIVTFSSQSGVGYMGENFHDCLKGSPESLISDPEASVIGHAFEAFADSGISHWGHPTAEWFIIYLLTEAAVTPHTIRHGNTTLSYLQGFVAIAKELENLHRPFARGDRSKLVARYVECIRNLKALHAQTTNQKEFIEKLKKDWENFEMQYELEGIEKSKFADAESAVDRLQWATLLLIEQEKGMIHLLTHFQDSLKIVFQQQNIELNELAIVADSQNNAILIFTSVTIIFLPLSFLTSYFGMNLQGVVETSHNQLFFWKICSGFATALLVLVFLTAYKKAVVSRARDLRRSARESLFAFQGLPTTAAGSPQQHDVESGNATFELRSRASSRERHE